ncbi:type II toxin-antitoxin system RelE/ParE family toxin [Fusobacterium nucleatum]|nr:type II toxin-antitoxin system RelE/ParE family toxin [Fusobacterium nucleatum]WDF24688.1 type II toxin-antitoxin system RelE/ParE family toxin [Fusobacterium nucleatum]
MKSYKVIYKIRAEKFIMINKIEGIKFYKAFQEIAKSKENYKKYDIKKFHYDNDYTFRLRIGSNRAIFEVYKDKIVILVLNIGSRGDIYK